jgi:hypothetical protein
MPQVGTALLFSMRLTLGQRQTAATPVGTRIYVPVTGGTIQGERIAGVVEDGGNDWLLIGTDRAVRIDCRLLIRTTDDHLIGVMYRGYRHGPPTVMERIDRGEEVDATEFYHRTAVFFETASEKYDWLNRVVALGVGRREAGRGYYDVYEVL